MKIKPFNILLGASAIILIIYLFKGKSSNQKTQKQDIKNDTVGDDSSGGGVLGGGGGTGGGGTVGGGSGTGSGGTGTGSGSTGGGGIRVMGGGTGSGGTFTDSGEGTIYQANTRVLEYEIKNKNSLLLSESEDIGMVLQPEDVDSSYDLELSNERVFDPYKGFIKNNTNNFF